MRQSGIREVIHSVSPSNVRIVEKNLFTYPRTEISVLQVLNNRAFAVSLDNECLFLFLFFLKQ